MNPTGRSTLACIAEGRRARIEALKLATPGFRLRERLGALAPAGRLQRALRRGAPSEPLRLLCGIQRAAPGRGLLRDFVDPAALARLCTAGGAAALAVATEPEHWQGELAWVDAARAACALPVLLDDVVVDEYQLLDAAVRGADGVLLVAALCSDVQLQVLASRARLLGLDPLVEVHDADELHRALKAGSTLVGLGSREPGGHGAGLEATLGLLPLVPALVAAVAWGVEALPAALEPLRATRCDAVLAGETLMAASDPAGTLASLIAAAGG